MKKTVKTEFSEYKNSRMRRAEQKWYFVCASLDYRIFRIHSVPDIKLFILLFCDYSVIKEPVFTGVKNYVTLFMTRHLLKHVRIQRT